MLQKDTIAGIEKYKEIVKDYQKTLKTTLANKKRREDMIADLSLATVVEEAKNGLLPTFVHFTKNKSHNYERLHSYLLAKSGNHKEAVMLYGAINDYNIIDKLNNVLKEVYLNNNPAGVDPKDFATAKKAILDETKKMLTDARHYQTFSTYPAFVKVLDERFPVYDFSI